MIHPTIQEEIKTLIDENPLMLFMKGDRKVPQCGFSGMVVTILERLGAPFHTCNVLESPELRQGIKDFTQWPTIPQLYVKGEFIGGADIMREMYDNGELEALFVREGLVLSHGEALGL